MLKRKVQVFVYRHNPGLEVLLLRRARPSREGAEGGGDWAPVTGNLEGREHVRQAAAREVLEETGLDTEPTPLGMTLTYEKNGKRFHETIFAARVAPGDEVELSEEHTSHEWVSAENAMTRLHWPDQKKALEFVVKTFGAR